MYIALGIDYTNDKSYVLNTVNGVAGYLSFKRIFDDELDVKGLRCIGNSLYTYSGVQSFICKAKSIAYDSTGYVLWYDGVAYNLNIDTIDDYGHYDLSSIDFGLDGGINIMLVTGHLFVNVKLHNGCLICRDFNREIRIEGEPMGLQQFCRMVCI